MTQAMDLQGHRGARGLLPENTLPGFAAALGIGVTTLELDLAVTRDGVVVVSHNPRIEPELARDAQGEWLREDSAPIVTMDLQQVKSYDVGRLNPGRDYAQRYPDQQPVDGTSIPTLDEVFELAARAGNQSVRFNIETKINPGKPEETPSPKAFVAAVVSVVERHGLSDRVNLQSFDWRSLAEVKAQAPGISTACLSAGQRWLDNLQPGQSGASPWLAGLDIDDFDGSVPQLVKAAGCDIWSPYHREVDTESIRTAQALGLKVKVWTVNDIPRMRELIAMGVDGIISDYPDRLRQAADEAGLALPVPTPVDD